MLTPILKFTPYHFNTTELAQQIDEEAIKLAQFTEFKTVCVVGGQNIEDQAFKMRKGVEVIVGTPGRIGDCLLNNYLVSRGWGLGVE
jgi:ATP-dependent RNA helicase DDX23/PRP28